MLSMIAFDVRFIFSFVIYFVCMCESVWGNVNVEKSKNPDRFQIYLLNFLQHRLTQMSVPYDVVYTQCTQLLVSMCAFHRRLPLSLNRRAFGRDRCENYSVRTGSLVLSWLPTRAVSVTLLIEVGAIKIFFFIYLSGKVFLLSLSFLCTCLYQFKYTIDIN